MDCLCIDGEQHLGAFEVCLCFFDEHIKLSSHHSYSYALETDKRDTGVIINNILIKIYTNPILHHRVFPASRLRRN